MDIKKFETEVDTLKSFFEIYCKDKHKNSNTVAVDLEYKGKIISRELKLCDECLDNIKYSFERLRECPHEIKPRCRKCPSPCYEKSYWKKTSKVMMYSGVQLGLIKVKDKIKGLFKK